MKTQWLALWDRLLADGNPEPIYNDLLRRYSEPGRAYHNLRHIEHCLSELAAFPEPADRNTVGFALWFHDAIYDTKAKDNEEQSAALGDETAINADLPTSFANAVVDLILATKHTAPPTTASAQLMVDIDLAILGQPQPVFDEYERQIREEYSWVPELDFRKGRSAILERFLEQSRIFSTQFFSKRYESRARENLVRSLGQLAA